MKVADSTGIVGQTFTLISAKGTGIGTTGANGGSMVIKGAEGIGLVTITDKVGKHTEGGRGGSVLIQSGVGNTKNAYGSGGNVLITAAVSADSSSNIAQSSGSINISTESATGYASTLNGDAYNRIGGDGGPVLINSGYGGLGGGSGGRISITAGSAGEAASSYNAGSAGSISITSGSGGSGLGTERTSSAGGDITISMGLGGIAASNAPGSTGGSFYVYAGEGGPGYASGLVNSRGTTGGGGGDITLKPGSSGALDNYQNPYQGQPGVGGSLWLYSGAGSTGAAGSAGQIFMVGASGSPYGGSGGSIIIVGGTGVSNVSNGATNTPITGQAGFVTIFAGAGSDSGSAFSTFYPATAGGNVSITCGAGGAANSTSGSFPAANGGGLTLTAGRGGPGSNVANPGSGGFVTISSGSPGTFTSQSYALRGSGDVRIRTSNVIADSSAQSGSTYLTAGTPSSYGTSGLNWSIPARQVGGVVIVASSPGGNSSSSGSAGAGGDVALYAGTGGASINQWNAGIGGAVNLRAGDGGNATNNTYTINGSNGGPITIRSGTGGTRSSLGNSGSGGDIEITTGSHGGISNSLKKSGAILIASGYGSGTNTGGGDINILTGTGNSVGGSINILSGGNGAGIGAPTPVTGGSVTINAGLGSTTNGSIIIGNSNTDSTTIGNSSNTRLLVSTTSIAGAASTDVIWRATGGYSLSTSTSARGWKIGPTSGGTARALLHVDGSYNYNNGGFIYYAKDGTSSSINYATGVVDTSIYASNRVVGSEFNSFSDMRNKADLGLSENVIDKFKQVKIRNFKWKNDPNEIPHKGVYAQELESLFPEFVSRTNGFIASVYKMSTSVTENGDLLIIDLSEEHSLTGGLIIKVIGETFGELVTPIVESGLTSISIKRPEKYSGGRVFVYGQEVDDYRNVNYEGLFSAAVEALQVVLDDVEDLKRRVKGLEA